MKTGGRSDRLFDGSFLTEAGALRRQVFETGIQSSVEEVESEIVAQVLERMLRRETSRPLHLSFSFSFFDSFILLFISFSFHVHFMLISLTFLGGGPPRCCRSSGASRWARPRRR